MHWPRLTARIGDSMLNNCPDIARWEHFQHGADIGIRGIGVTKSQAFEQAGLALTAVVASPEKIRDLTGIGITCNSTDDEFLFLDWINTLIFEMTTPTCFSAAFRYRWMVRRCWLLEEAPAAYKDVNEVVDAADEAGLARKVARLEPEICIKG